MHTMINFAFKSIDVFTADDAICRRKHNTGEAKRQSVVANQGTVSDNEHTKSTAATPTAAHVRTP